MNKLSSQDRSSLIRLASSLPAGSSERKAILAGLQPQRTATSANKVLAWLRKYRAQDGFKVEAILGLDGHLLSSSAELNPGDQILEWTYSKTFQKHPIYSDMGGEVEEPYTHVWAIGANGLPNPYQDGLGHGPGHAKSISSLKYKS